MRVSTRHVRTHKHSVCTWEEDDMLDEMMGNLTSLTKQYDAGELDRAGTRRDTV